MASLMLLNECKPVNTLVTDFEDLIHLRHPTHVAYPLFVFFTILKQRSSQKSANV
jgi:hypothetical protein